MKLCFILFLFTITSVQSVKIQYGRVNRPAHTWPWKFPLQTNIVHHDEKTNRAIAIDHVTLFILLSEGHFLIVMIYLLSLHEIMFYFIFVHNYIWLLDKAFNIDFCLFNFVHVLLFTITSNKHRTSRWKNQSGDSNWPRHTEHVHTSNQIMFNTHTSRVQWVD
jgi:hypothetical protein